MKVSELRYPWGDFPCDPSYHIMYIMYPARHYLVADHIFIDNIITFLKVHVSLKQIIDTYLVHTVDE